MIRSLAMPVIVLAQMTGCSLFPFENKIYPKGFSAISQDEKEIQLAVRLDHNNPINLRTFYAIDRNGEKREVIMQKRMLPVDFSKSDQLVIIGEYHANTFFASNVLIKYGNKYNLTHQSSI
jgi:hypothetical protein